MSRSHLAALIVTIACMLMAGAAFAADESDTQQATVGGTIPELCQLGIFGGFQWPPEAMAQDGSGEYSYDQGYMESPSDALVLTIDANKSWKLEINYAGTGWSCPSGYDKAETDLLMRITNSPTGTIQNGYNNYRSPPAEAGKEQMLNHTAGVSNNTVNIQGKILLDWTKDIPGQYQLNLTYTLTTTSS